MNLSFIEEKLTDIQGNIRTTEELLQYIVACLDDLNCEEYKTLLEKFYDAKFHPCYADFIHIVLKELIVLEKDSIIEYLYSNPCEDVFLCGLYQMARAFLYFKHLELESGAQLFHKALSFCFEGLQKGNPAIFADFTFLMQNAYLLENVSWPISQHMQEPKMTILYEDRFENSNYTCSIICDFVYFYKYSEKFIEDFRAQCGNVNIFIVVVNPNKNILSRIKKYRGIIYASISYKGKWIAEFSASARFILANKIMKITNSPTIFMDIDSTFPEGSKEILSILAKENLALCDTGEVYPFLRVSAALLSAQPSETTYLFFEAVKNFILEDFTREGPLWGLDQVALFRAYCLARKKGWGISNINSLFPSSMNIVFPSFFTKKNQDVIPLDQRLIKRSSSYYMLTGIDKNYKTMVRYSPQ